MQEIVWTGILYEIYNSFKQWYYYNQIMQIMSQHCSSALHLIYHLHPKQMEDDAGKMLLI